MLGKKIAVIDLGTNVFNLLIAEFSDNGYKYIKEFKYPSLIGAGGISKGIISEKAFATADKALAMIMNVIEENGGADIIIPLATSAIRDASNCSDFVKYFNDKFGIKIEVIPGVREAELIFKGILLSLGKIKINGNMLFLDIGGGSNEFIITDGSKILWKQSFPIGMARMKELFKYQEPIPNEVVEQFKLYCTNELKELWEQIEIYKPDTLIGSSGSFDTFKDIIFECEYEDSPSIGLEYDDLYNLDVSLRESITSDRLKIKGMSIIRVDYIVLASIFVQLILEKTGIKSIYQSSFSLKEGAVQDFYEKNCN
jgi:Exopolyphosphatase